MCYIWRKFCEKYDNIISADLNFIQSRFSGSVSLMNINTVSLIASTEAPFSAISAKSNGVSKGGKAVSKMSVAFSARSLSLYSCEWFDKMDAWSSKNEKQKKIV